MSRKAYMLVLAVFVLGLVAGALGGYLWGERVVAAGQSGKRSHVERLTTLLSLTPQQHEQVRAILADTKAQFDATYDSIRPQMDAIRLQGRQNIRALLTPQQLPLFEDYLRKIDEERKSKGR